MPLEQQFGPISHWKIRVRSHNASHNFPRENDPKIRPANPPYKEPVARKQQGQRFTKNDHWGHTKLMHGPKKMQPGHTCRQQRQNSLAFSQTTVFRSQQQSTIFKSPVISSTSNGSMPSTASAQFFVFSRQESGRSPQAQTSRSSVQRGKQSRVFFNLAWNYKNPRELGRLHTRVSTLPTLADGFGVDRPANKNHHKTHSGSNDESLFHHTRHVSSSCLGSLLSLDKSTAK